jgi:drug/metabolite transporter (DMT)-like permease
MASRKVGSMVLNRSRLIAAILWLLLAHLLLRTGLPFYATPRQWFWFGLSGFLGLTLGDLCLFQAYIWIGPRLAMLLMALAPALAAIVAWLFMGETLAAVQVLGITLTLAGILWVVAEKNGQSGQFAKDRKQYLLGLLCGLGGATGQALGLVTAKVGSAGGFSPISGTLMRMVVAAAFLWGLTFLTRQAKPTIQALTSQPGIIRLVMAGAFAGPFLGVTFSLIAVQNTAIGIASTLTALPPVILLPISHFFYHERIGWQAILGTLMAMAGVALLFVV